MGLVFCFVHGNDNFLFAIYKYGMEREIKGRRGVYNLWILHGGARAHTHIYIYILDIFNTSKGI